MKINTPRTIAKKYARRAASAVDMFVVGVQNPRTGTPNHTADKPEHYVRGVQAGRNAYARGWAPYREILLKLKLPPRGKRGSKANIRRIKVVCDALHREKLRRQQLAAMNGAR